VALARVDRYGNLLWQRIFDEPNNSGGRHILLTPDQGYAIIGELSNSGGCLIKVDANGK